MKTRVAYFSSLICVVSLAFTFGCTKKEDGQTTSLDTYRLALSNSNHGVSGAQTSLNALASALAGISPTDPEAASLLMRALYENPIPDVKSKLEELLNQPGLDAVSLQKLKDIYQVLFGALPVPGTSSLSSSTGLFLRLEDLIDEGSPARLADLQSTINQLVPTIQDLIDLIADLIEKLPPLPPVAPPAPACPAVAPPADPANSCNAYREYATRQSQCNFQACEASCLGPNKSCVATTGPDVGGPCVEGGNPIQISVPVSSWVCSYRSYNRPRFGSDQCPMVGDPNDSDVLCSTYDALQTCLSNNFGTCPPGKEKRIVYVGGVNVPCKESAGPPPVYGSRPYAHYVCVPVNEPPSHPPVNPGVMVNP